MKKYLISSAVAAFAVAGLATPAVAGPNNAVHETSGGTSF